jgi:hypothetical protein
MVLTLGRGIVFCQIYEYGKDLYVGWNAHLNLGQWVEAAVGQGIDKSTGELTQFKTVTNAVQRPNEYDVTDLSCLIEWTHAQLTKLLKQMMAERQIDQEIDFKILRGERQQLTAGAVSDKGGGIFSRFKRAA